MNLKWKCCGHKNVNIKEVPIIINNFNRLEYLKRLIDSLQKRGYSNIIILDNNSSYPPLLSYYDTCEYTVIRLSKNYGFLALWQSGIYKKYWGSYYVYTDSDMEIDANCPEDFINKFIGVLTRYPLCYKVGFGICIDDIPDSFSLKAKVIEHESQFWEKKLDDGLYYAIIDTTFALYRPFTKGASSPYKLMIRTGSPYLIRHLPWYVDSNLLSKEDKYYMEHIIQSTHWTKASNDMLKTSDNKTF